jgi:hypothetical protein
MSTLHAHPAWSCGMSLLHASAASHCCMSKVQGGKSVPGTEEDDVEEKGNRKCSWFSFVNQN